MKFHTAKKILESANIRLVKPSLHESEEVYEDDVRDWIVKDTSRAVSSEVRALENCILSNYRGGRLLSVSDTYVEDITYLHTRRGPSYSGTIFVVVKAEIPSTYLTGNEENDVEVILDKIRFPKPGVLSGVEWDCKSYVPEGKMTLVKFEMRASYSN
jgi:hypothetical protein